MWIGGERGSGVCRKVAAQCVWPCPAQCSCPACTAPGVGLWPPGLVYPGQTESLNMAAAASTWILLVFYMYFHWWTSILASQRQEQVGAVAAVWVCAASHLSIPTGGICVFCVCWAHVSSLAATWIWGHGVAASPLLGCCIQIMPFLLAWSSWACQGLQMCVPAINI